MIKIYLNFYIYYFKIYYGDWGLGIGPNPQSPIPNPQSPNPQSPLILLLNKYIYFILFFEQFLKFK